MYTLKQLIYKAYQELLDSGLSEKTVYGANWYIWNRLIRLYGEDEIFNEDMCFKYCESYFGRDIFNIDDSNLLKIERGYIIAFNNLILSSKDMPFIKKDFHFRRDYKLDDYSLKLLNDYLKFSKESGNNERTIENKTNRIRNFIIDIDFKNISQETVINYLRDRRTKQGLIAYNIETRLIRRFLLFCYEQGKLEKSIIHIWPDKMINIENKKIPSVYSKEEIQTLLRSAKIFTHEDNHLRNYAILCLIIYTGIRATDVANLKPYNFNWRENKITFVQQKTKRELTYPLIPQIGNPIIKYIKNERKHGEYMFTKENGSQINTKMVTGIINRYFENAPIDIGERHYGAHALRHSIATNLVNSGVSMFTVANTLGHSDIRSVKIYGKVDITHLRKCVLEAPYYA